jgi:ADP-ribose pyrophosphatase YjhB (NUDIX family)
VTCAACGVSHWRNSKPCANAIVVRDDKVLLARRAYARWKDARGSPGGFCEAGEHPVETVEREVLEETGLKVSVTGYLGVWVDTYADDPPEPDADVINVAYYTATALDGDETAFDRREVSEVGWFGWDELPPDLAPPSTLEGVLAAARAGTPLADLSEARRRRG